MPRGIYQNNSLYKKGNKHSLGVKRSEETKIKMSKAKKGRKMTPEFRKKISQSMKKAYKEGRKNANHLKGSKTISKEIRLQISNKLKGRISPMKGKNHTEKTRLKMSASRKGEQCHFWQGGITPINLKIRNSLEYKLWRESVFKRDNYTCVWCFKKGGKLNADHIKPFSLYPELRFAIDNGRTLCIDCHKKTDSFGWKNYWNNYIAEDRIRNISNPLF